jgi:tRNA(adenine34) deaminase
MKDHFFYMGRALSEAKKAFGVNEVPVGAILIKDGKILAKAHNLTRTKKDPTAHAEMVVIQKAAGRIKNERFGGCCLYVTLEPCAMCAGAIVQARISTVVYGTKDPKAGACGSVLKVLPNRKLNHRPNVIEGVMAEESAKLLKDFFRGKR